MTYRQLEKKISRMTDEEKDLTATVYLKHADEYIAVERLEETNDDGVLDLGHPVLSVPF